MPFLSGKSWICHCERGIEAEWRMLIKTNVRGGPHRSFRSRGGSHSWLAPELDRGIRYWLVA